MSHKGRKPTPTVLKLLRGNPGKRAINLDEPVPEALEPACPEELTDEIARAEWARVVAPAIRLGQVTAADRALAIAHCELWANRRRQLTEAAGYASNVIEVGTRGYLIPNPALTMAAKTLTLLLKVDAELGFTPTSRSRVVKVGPKAPTLTGLDKARAKFLEGSG
jgi:P27 family predicted phage terminase small subunit